MRTYDLIGKKKRGGSFLMEEIAYMVRGPVVGGIPGCQMSAMLATVYFGDMDDQEITDLALEMTYSRDAMDLSPIGGIKAGKHSTSGVGDKTALVTGPIVATYGAKMAKTNGRSPEYTGGTVDKLESIPGLETAIPRKEFFRIVNENGLAPIGQSGNMTPVDKKLYALRDMTATVDNIPLTASSIMSKKLTAGSDCIVPDVKAESGAFIEILEDSISLAWEMVSIRTLADRRCCALITSMDASLGHAIGSFLEAEEAIEAPKGHEPEDLACICLKLAANMLHMTDGGDVEQCRRIIQGATEDGSTLKCLKPMAENQDGDGRYVKNPGLFHEAPLSREVKAPEAGFITHMGTERIGVISVILGVGRNKKEDTTDYSADILLEKKYGDSVREGETITVLYASHEELFGPAMEKSLASCILGKQMLEPEPLIFARISDAGVERRTIEEKAP